MNVLQFSILLFFCSTKYAQSQFFEETAACFLSSERECDTTRESSSNYMYSSKEQTCYNPRRMCSGGLGGYYKTSNMCLKHSKLQEISIPSSNVKIPLCCYTPLRLSLFILFEENYENINDIIPKDFILNSIEDSEIYSPRSCTVSSVGCVCEVVANHGIPNLIDYNNGKILKYCFAGQPFEKEYNFMVDENFQRKRCKVTKDCNDTTRQYVCSPTVVSHFDEATHEFILTPLFCVKPYALTGSKINHQQTDKLFTGSNFGDCRNHADCTGYGNSAFEFAVCNRNNNLGVSMCQVHEASSTVCETGKIRTPLVYCGTSSSGCNADEAYDNSAICDPKIGLCCELDTLRAKYRKKILCPDQQTPVGDQIKCSENEVCPITGGICYGGHCCPELKVEKNVGITNIGSKPFRTNTTCDPNTYYLGWQYAYCHNTDKVMIVAGIEKMKSREKVIEEHYNYRCTINMNCRKGLVCLQFIGSGRCILDPMGETEKFISFSTLLLIISLSATIIFCLLSVVIISTYSICYDLSFSQAYGELMDFCDMISVWR